MCPDEKVLRSDADETMLDRLIQTLGVHRPTAEQAAVILHPLDVEDPKDPKHKVASPLLVVAGAGSGKTETMSLRAVYLAAMQGVQEESILGLTFTKKAASELEGRLSERLAQLRSDGGAGSNLGLLEFESGPQASTYNAFALDVVREFGSQLGMPTDFIHLDSAAGWQLMVDIVEQWTGPIDTDLERTTIADGAIQLREEIINQALTLPEVKASLLRLERKIDTVQSERKRSSAFLDKAFKANRERLDLLAIVEEFERQKNLLGRFDFADQVTMAARIVRELPGARQELRSRHKVVFLDEFQDTSVAQLRFLSELFGDHPVTAVGDPNQAIYGWRGASAASLDDFHDLFSTDPRSPRTTLNLSTAWRNPTRVLTVANSVAEPLRKSPSWAPHMEVQAPSPELKSRRDAPPGEVITKYATSVQEETDTIIDFLQKYYAEPARQGKRVTAAVLCRTRAPIQPLLEACREAGIPAETGGEDGLLLHPAVLDQRAALAVCHDIGKSAQMLRLVGNLDLGARDLWHLGELAQSLAWQSAKRESEAAASGNRPDALLVEAVDHVARLDVSSDEELHGPAAKITQAGRARLAVLGKQLEEIRSAGDWTIVEQVEYARKVLGTDEQAFTTGDIADVTEVLDAFSQAAAHYDASAVDATMTGFLGWLDVAESKERGLPLPSVQSNPNAVQIMTIHGAKGLEWDLVVVPRLSCSTFPNNRGNASRPVKDAEGRLVSVDPPATPAPQSGWWTATGLLPYPVRRDRAHLPDPEIWDPEMGAGVLAKLFKEDVGAYLYAEERRLAYVAFTRPKQKLLLTGHWIGSGTTPRYPSPFFLEAAQALGIIPDVPECPLGEEAERLRAAGGIGEFPITPGPIRRKIELSASKVLAEIDQLQMDPELGGLRQADLVASLSDQRLASTVRVLLEEIKKDQAWSELSSVERARLQVTGGRGRLKSLTTTELGRLTQQEEVWLNLRRPLPAKPLRGAALGNAFHAWVEGYLRRASAAGSEEEPQLSGGSGSLSDALTGLEVQGAVLTEGELRRLELLIERFQTMNWLTDYSAEALEMPFAVEVGELLIRGRVDAVLRGQDDEILLVDWKTGYLPNLDDPSPLQKEELTRYLVQLEVYEHAWKELNANARVKSELVFVGPERWVRVSLHQLQEARESWGEQPLDLKRIAADWQEQFGDHFLGNS